MSECFSEQLNVNPFDWKLREQWAKQLNEYGYDAYADAQRWMAEHKKCPYMDDESNFQPEWCWWVDYEDQLAPGKIGLNSINNLMQQMAGGLTSSSSHGFRIILMLVKNIPKHLLKFLVNNEVLK